MEVQVGYVGENGDVWEYRKYKGEQEFIRILGVFRSSEGNIRDTQSDIRIQGYIQV